MAAAMAALPAVSRVMFNACKIGTPLVTNVPSVRAKREIAVLRFKLPKSGIRSLKLSMSNRPRRVRPIVLYRVIRAITMPSRIRPWFFMKPLAPMTNRVTGGSGLSPSKSWKNLFEPRHNEDKKKRHNPHGNRHHDAGIDHCRHNLVFDLRGFLLKFRKPGEHQLQYTADLAGLHHVDV